MHQLSRGASQNPFRKNRGRVVRVLFHPSKPFFFVATQQNVRAHAACCAPVSPTLPRLWPPYCVGMQPAVPPTVACCSLRLCQSRRLPQRSRPRTPLTFHSLSPSPPVQVRVYNLAKQALAKKLVAGSGVITSMAVHPSGDHLIVGAEDKRLWWAAILRCGGRKGSQPPGRPRTPWAAWAWPPAWRGLGDAVDGASRRVRLGRARGTQPPPPAPAPLRAAGSTWTCPPSRTARCGTTVTPSVAPPSTARTRSSPPPPTTAQCTSSTAACTPT